MAARRDRGKVKPLARARHPTFTTPKRKTKQKLNVAENRLEGGPYHQGGEESSSDTDGHAGRSPCAAREEDGASAAMMCLGEKETAAPCEEIQTEN